MKYYKLKNDIPMFKKGDLFFIHPEEGCLLQKDTLRLAYHKKTLEKNPEILKDWFEEIEGSKNKRWRAKKFETYWFINGYGEIEYDDEYGLNTNDNLYAIGNYFKTAKEADDYRKYLIARQTLLDDTEGGKWNKKSNPWVDSDNWSTYYNDSLQEWQLEKELLYRPGIIYFKTRKALEKSLKEHKEQWGIVRKYEMGEM